MKTDIRDVYEQLGNIFYAIAKEQHVKPLEVAELKLLVTRDWLPRNQDTRASVLSDEAHCILVTMDSLHATDAPASEAFRLFTVFYRLHPEVFTVELKKKIYETAVEITKIFAADNKAGNRILADLRKLLQLPEFSNA